jgi:hypothetical protein
VAASAEGKEVRRLERVFYALGGDDVMDAEIVRLSA